MPRTGRRAIDVHAVDAALWTVWHYGGVVLASVHCSASRPRVFSLDLEPCDCFVFATKNETFSRREGNEEKTTLTHAPSTSVRWKVRRQIETTLTWPVRYGIGIGVVLNRSSQVILIACYFRKFHYWMVQNRYTYSYDFEYPLVYFSIPRQIVSEQKRAPFLYDPIFVYEQARTCRPRSGFRP